MRRSRIITGLTAVALVLPLGAMTVTATAAPPDDMGGGDSTVDTTPNVGLGPVLSGDGSTVAFESKAALLSDDVNTVPWSRCTSDPADPAVPAGMVQGVVDVTDVYRYDLGTKALLDRPSRANTEGLPDGVAPFEATGFRVDGHTGLCVPAGNGADPAISADGSAVAFVSSGNLVGRVVEEEDSHEVSVTAEGSGTTDGTSIEPNVYLNAGADSTVWASDDGGSAGRELPAMSADGQYVALVGRSSASNGVWVKDTTSDVPATRLASGMLFNVDISPDGNVIAWAKYGTADSGGQAVYVVEKTPGQSWNEFGTDTLTPELVSVSDSGLKAEGPTDFPSLSEDGRHVAFQSMDKTLDAEALPGPTGGGPNKVYVHDRQTGDTEMVSVADTDAGDVIVNGNAIKPALTPDGRYVAFASDAGILQGASEDESDHATVAAEEEEEESFQQVYLRDRNAETTTPVSLALDEVDPADGLTFGDGGSSTSYGPSISDDGTLVAFESDATNLVEGDTNGDTDAFVWDGSDGSITRVSVDAEGNQVDLSPDSAKPQSRAHGKSITRRSPLTVTYEASDPIFPSLGVASVQLWVRKPGEDTFTRRQTDLGTAMDGRFTVVTKGVNGLYRFKTVAVDGNGNVEDLPGVADAITRLDTVKPAIRAAKVTPAPFDMSRDRKATFRFRVAEKAYRTIVVKHDGIVVKRFATKLHPRGLTTQTWRGRNDVGRKVHDGRYVVVMRAVDLAGNRSVARVPVRVTR